MLRRWLLLYRVDVLLVPQLFPVRPTNGCVEKSSPVRAGFIVARPVVGPHGRVRGAIGTALCPLAVLLTGRRLPIDLFLSLQKKIELSRLLPPLDLLCLEVQPLCLSLLQQMTACLALAVLCYCGLVTSGFRWSSVPPSFRRSRR